MERKQRGRRRALAGDIRPQSKHFPRIFFARGDALRGDVTQIKASGVVENRPANRPSFAGEQWSASREESAGGVFFLLASAFR